VASYAIDIQVTTHVLDHVQVPRYSASSDTHRQLATLSQRAHDLSEAGDAAALEAIRDDIDGCVTNLWNLTAQEVAEIRSAIATHDTIGPSISTATPNSQPEARRT
jgi:hypothetical protein